MRGLSSTPPSWRIVALAVSTTFRWAHAEQPSAPSDAGPAPAEVVVEGQRPLLISSPRAQTAASTVITQDGLSRLGDSSADVLKQVPGVHVQRTGSASETATASIRGTSASQTPVYLAGIRLNDELTGSADLSTVPLWMLQRVEVFRGNAPAGSARLGLGGAVFLEPRRPLQSRLGTSVSVGSFSERGAWAQGEVAGRQVSALVALRHSRAQNDFLFLNDNGQRFDLRELSERRANADFAQNDGWVIGEYRIGRARVVSVLSAFDREQGVTGVATTPARRARARLRRLLGGVSVSVPCDALGSCELQAHASGLLEYSTLLDPFRELRTTRTDNLHVAGKRFEQGVRLGWSPLNRLEVGTDVSHDSAELSLTPRGGLPQQAVRDVVGLSLDANLRVSEGLVTHAMIAARCDATSGTFLQLSQLSTVDNAGCNVTTPDARAGVALELSSSWTLLSNLARYSRLPTLGELYGTSIAVQGNPELEQEKSINADVGVRATDSGRDWQLALDTFGFVRWAGNLVRYRQTSLDAFSPYNVGRARITGVELALGAELFEHLGVRSAMTLLDPRETTADGVADPTANDILPLMPRLVTSHLVEVHGSRTRWNIERASLGVRHFYSSNRLVDRAGLAALPSSHLWDAQGAVHLYHPDLEFAASINNVFDSRALDIIGLPLPSRSFHASLTAWW
jgi:iron complex outermembrane receptor protein